MGNQMDSNTKHIILGAGGAISKSLTEELIRNKEKVRLISRSGHSMNGAESVKADLTDFISLKNVVEDSTIVYLTAGLKYDKKIWEDNWPKIMQNVVKVCKEKNAKLIFFDNVYAYGLVKGKMTEDTPYNPVSKKGEIRAKLANSLMTEVRNGNINAIIARSADFYGPYSEKTSLPGIMVIENLSKDKKAQWMANAKAIHSFTYTLDCGKALYLLSKSDDSFNRIWHMPTAHPPITGEEFINIIAGKLGKKNKYMVLQGWMIKLGGLFNALVGELYEMLYQYKYDYFFDSSQFENKFHFSPTSYEAGISESLKFFKSNKG